MLASEIVRDIEEALAADEPRRGLHLADHLLGTFPEHLRARTLRAKALLALAEYDEAAGDVATALGADLLNIDAMLVSAKLAEARGDLHQAHALIGRAASIDSGHHGVRQAVAESVTMLPRDPAALGFAYLNSDWPDLAEREFRQALERDPARVDIRIALAEALWRQGRFEEARPECRTVLDHYPRCLRATLMMAHILAEQGRTAHGMEMLERAGEMDPEYAEAAELYAKATLSRMRLPPPPSVPEPPVFAEDAVDEVEEPAEAGSGESAVDAERGTGTSVDGAEDIPGALDDGEPDGGDQKEPRQTLNDHAESESGEMTGKPGVDRSASDSQIEPDRERRDEDAVAEVRDADEASPEATQPAQSIEFAAGWPAGAGRLTAAGEDEEPDPTPALLEGDGETDGPGIADSDKTGRGGGDVPRGAEDSSEAPGERSEPEPTVDVAGADSGDNTDDDIVGTPLPGESSISAKYPAEAPPDAGGLDSEPPAGDGPDGAGDKSAELGGPDAAGGIDGERILEMARFGSWGEVAGALAEMLATGDVKPVAALVEELAKLPGFPSSIWQTLGDSYMRGSEPRLASEAYSRAVRKTTE